MTIVVKLPSYETKCVFIMFSFPQNFVKIRFQKQKDILEKADF